MSFIDLTLVCLTAICAVPVAVVFAQMVAATAAIRPSPLPCHPRPGLAVVVPAHDEGQTIAQTIAWLLPELTDTDRLLVVADNCSDATAAIAHGAGAEVLERQDLERRGKGFALQAGLDFINRTGPREIIVFVDADCTMTAGGIAHIARLSAAIDRPVQAAYVMSVAPSAPTTHRIAAFASTVKTVGRPLGWSRLGGPCHLAGTGIAIPARLLAQVELASAHLAEDLKLGMDLALRGTPPRFCANVEVRSELPESREARRSQQTRWEHGHLALMQLYAPRLLREALRRRDPALLAMALDLCVPPLAALILVTGLLGLVTLARVAFGGSPGPFFAAAGVSALLGLALALAWSAWGRPYLRWRDLLAMPRFVLGKAPILFRFVFDRQVEWVRAERGSATAIVRPAPLVQKPEK